jgi:hypothetical protein
MKYDRVLGGRDSSKSTRSRAAAATTTTTSPETLSTSSTFDGQVCWSCAANKVKKAVKRVVKRGSHVVRAVRNSGSTAAGVGWAYLNGGSCRMRKGLMVACTGMRWGYGFRGGFTVGNTFMTNKKRVSNSLMRHEAGHATQWAIFGNALPVVYAADYIQARGNPCRQLMERSAGSGGGYRC